MANAEAQDSGLASLTLLLRFYGAAVDAQQIKHRFNNASFETSGILRCANGYGLKARAITSSWAKLERLPLPAVAQLSEGLRVR